MEGRSFAAVHFQREGGSRDIRSFSSHDNQMCQARRNVSVSRQVCLYSLKNNKLIYALIISVFLFVRHCHVFKSSIVEEK